MSLPHGRAKVDANSPRAFGVCDRCGFLYNHSDLHWQYDFRGRSLANLRILVCFTCEDDPQPQLKPRVIPPDPVPIMNARPERYAEYNSNIRITSGQNTVDFWTGIPIVQGNTRITQDSNVRSEQQSGAAPGSKTLFPGVRFTVPGDGADDVPPNSLGIPETGHIVEQTTYDVWTNNPVNPMYWTNDDGDQVYWNEPPPTTPAG